MLTPCRCQGCKDHPVPGCCPNKTKNVHFRQFEGVKIPVCLRCAHRLCACQKNTCSHPPGHCGQSRRDGKYCVHCVDITLNCTCNGLGCAMPESHRGECPHPRRPEIYYKNRCLNCFVGKAKDRCVCGSPLCTTHRGRCKEGLSRNKQKRNWAVQKTRGALALKEYDNLCNTCTFSLHDQCRGCRVSGQEPFSTTTDIRCKYYREHGDFCSKCKNSLDTTARCMCQNPLCTLHEQNVPCGNEIPDDRYDTCMPCWTEIQCRCLCDKTTCKHPRRDDQQRCTNVIYTPRIDDVIFNQRSRTTGELETLLAAHGQFCRDCRDCLQCQCRDPSCAVGHNGSPCTNFVPSNQTSKKDFGYHDEDNQYISTCEQCSAAHQRCSCDGSGCPAKHLHLPMESSNSIRLRRRPTEKIQFTKNFSRGCKDTNCNDVSCLTRCVNPARRESRYQYKKCKACSLPLEMPCKCENDRCPMHAKDNKCPRTMQRLELDLAQKPFKNSWCDLCDIWHRCNEIYKELNGRDTDVFYRFGIRSKGSDDSTNLDGSNGRRCLLFDEDSTIAYTELTCDKLIELGAQIADGSKVFVVYHRWLPHGEWHWQPISDVTVNRSNGKLAIVQYKSTILSASDFQHLGLKFGLEFLGVGRPCLGSTSQFSYVHSEIPSTPGNIPPSKRHVFWKIKREDGEMDLVVGSLNMIFELATEIGGFWWLSREYALLWHTQNPVSLGDLRTEMRRRICEVKETHDLLHDNVLTIPLRQHYVSLATFLGCVYKGCMIESELVEADIPKTGFERMAVLEKNKLGLPHLPVEKTSVDYTTKKKWSFEGMYFAWYKQAPTETTIQTILEESGNPLTAEMLQAQHFPGYYLRTVEAMHRGAMIMQTLRRADEEDLRFDFPSYPGVELEDDALPDPRTGPKHLFQQEARERVNALTHPEVPNKVGRVPREGELVSMKLHTSPEHKFGYDVAVVRGMKFLKHHYYLSLAHHFEEVRGSDKKSDSTRAAFGCGANRTPKYEMLPLHPVIKKHVTSFESLTITSVLEALQLALLQEPDLKDLTALIHAHQLPGLRTRIRGKQAPSANSILTKFAIIAWVKQSERWVDMPKEISPQIQCVSNLDAFEIRSMTALVAEEYAISAKPLTDRLCAWCGHLLQSPLNSTSRVVDGGKAGEPCQIRGRSCSWYSFPPFLFLFSKVTLTKRLPSLFQLEDQKLRLNPNIDRLPWVRYNSRAMLTTNAKKGKKTSGLKLQDTLTENIHGRRSKKVIEGQWWHCIPCHKYFQQTASGVYASNQRVPMRNMMEGHYTKWHADLAYPLIHDLLQERYPFPSIHSRYPAYKCLPNPAEVLPWKKELHEVLERMTMLNKNTIGSVMTSEDTQGDMAKLEKRRAELNEVEKQWVLPPHATPWGSPIPPFYFELKWIRSWKPWQGADLVLEEQSELLQNLPESIPFREILSADARAAISVCRPLGQFTEKRNTKGTYTMPTFLHQSGSLPLLSPFPAVDYARGMITGIVAREDFRKEFFQLRANEPAALEQVLSYLLRNNPWLRGYKASCQQLNKQWSNLKDLLETEGRLLPGGLERLTTDAKEELEQCLGVDDSALLMPIDTFQCYSGSYQHMRAAAEIVATSPLARLLPPDWQAMHKSQVFEEDPTLEREDIAVGTEQPPRPFCRTPPAFDTHMAFSNVSFRDANVEAKTFVRQFPYGTGSFRSSVDCCTSKKDYQRSRFWSLDGEYLDHIDPHWIFWQKEFDIKTKLAAVKRYEKPIPLKRKSQVHDHKSASKQKTKGHDMNGKSSSDLAIGGEVVKEKKDSHQQDYCRRMYSDRVGKVLPDSNQSLAKERYNALELCKADNLGPATAMITFVGNEETSAITAHITKGAFAKPDPEDTLSKFFRTPHARLPVASTGHAGIKTAEYMRRRGDFQLRSLRRGPHDSLVGRITDRTRRTEGQKKGYPHDHFIIWNERCGYITPGKAQLPATCEIIFRPSKDPVPHPNENSSDDEQEHKGNHLTANETGNHRSNERDIDANITDGECAGTVKLGNFSVGKKRLCRSLSLWCLSTGESCRLPQEVHGAVPHQSAHLAYCQGELVRPFPLGAPPHVPKAPDKKTREDPDLGIYGSTLTDKIFTHENHDEIDLDTNEVPKRHYPTIKRSSLPDRIRTELYTVQGKEPPRLGDVMNLSDLIVAFYFRGLQIGTFVHDCVHGYCIKDGTSICRFFFPFMNVSSRQHQNADLERLLPVRRYPPDDAWVKVHNLRVLIRHLSNIQINVHHDREANKATEYELKYIHKGEPHTRITYMDPNAPEAMKYLNAQFISLPMATHAILGGSIYSRTRVVPFAFPSWNPSIGSMDWQMYVHRINGFDAGNCQPHSGKQLLEALRMATFHQVARYFSLSMSDEVIDSDKDEDDDEVVNEIEETNTNCTRTNLKKRKKMDAVVLNFRNWDSAFDSTTHPHYTQVFSATFPTSRFYAQRGSQTYSYRKHRHSFLAVGRFMEYEPTLAVDHLGVSNRSKYFEFRIFRVLNWRLAAKRRILVSSVPDDFPNILDWSSFEGLIEWSDDRTFHLGPQYFSNPDDNGTQTSQAERTCQILEKTFSETSLVCPCCEQKSEHRCLCCKKAIGWHQCRKSNFSWVWKRESLWRPEDDDAEVYILDMMLNRRQGLDALTDSIEKLRKDDLINDATHKRLLELVLANRGRIIDHNDLLHPSNDVSIASAHARSKDPEFLQSELDRLLAKFQNVWCTSHSSYVHYLEAGWTVPPDQARVFEQLVFRFREGEAIVLAIIGPAGFGKTELMLAWKYFTLLQGEDWAFMAPSGVAATNTGGSTLHTFGMLDEHGISKLPKPESRKARERFSQIRGLVIDECFMVSIVFAQDFFDLLQSVPLAPELRTRCRNPLPMFGYRGVVTVGDTRQLPPANGEPPFYTMTEFKELFEIMVLRHDRRHERNPSMQLLKEKIAWGGTLKPVQNSDDSKSKVDADLYHCFLNAYLRGWGLCPDKVDPDVGTALFARRAQMSAWNNGVVDELESRYGGELEAVNVRACSSATKGVQSKSYTQNTIRRSARWFQAPGLLRLRTCLQHRMRVILLSNLNVSLQWANGTRARLLPSDSWTKPTIALQTGQGQLKAQEIDLSEAKYRDWNVRIVRDSEDTAACKNRYKPIDVTAVPHLDESKKDYDGRVHFQNQIQLSWGYGLTGHKAQGLTLLKTYLSMEGLFACGQSYTKVTRTPLEHNILCIGVPPMDILHDILREDAAGLTLIDHKKEEIKNILGNPTKLQDIVNQRIEINEYKHAEIHKSLGHSSPYSTRNVEEVNRHLLGVVTREYESWHDRLELTSGVRNMVKVPGKFKIKESDMRKGLYTEAIQPHRDKDKTVEERWPTLRKILMSDPEKTIAVHTITKGWIEHDEVDVLRHCKANQPFFPIEIIPFHQPTASTAESRVGLSWTHERPDQHFRRILIIRTSLGGAVDLNGNPVNNVHGTTQKWKMHPQI